MESPRKDSHFYREALRTILPEGGEWHCMLGPFGSCVGLELVHREAVPRRGLKLLCVSGIGGGGFLPLLLSPVGQERAPHEVCT